jgi:hypothetical protein
VCASGAFEAARAWVEGAGVRSEGEKAGIPPRIVVIGFGLGVSVAFDFNDDEFLLVIF